jgi:hypothetical protein
MNRVQQTKRKHPQNAQESMNNHPVMRSRRGKEKLALFPVPQGIQNHSFLIAKDIGRVRKENIPGRKRGKQVG